MKIISFPSQIFLGLHDHEARGSSSATDLVLLAILEGMRANQQRAAEEQVRHDRELAAVNAAM
jgi:hypothetical protein